MNTLGKALGVTGLGANGMGLLSPCLRPGFGNTTTFRYRISAKVKGCTAALSLSLCVSRCDQAELTYLQIQILDPAHYYAVKAHFHCSKTALTSTCI